MSGSGTGSGSGPHNFKFLTEDSSLEWGENGLIWRRVARCESLVNNTPEGADAGYLAAVLALPDCPLRGSKEQINVGTEDSPTWINVYCMNVKIRHVKNSKDKAIVEFLYGEAGKVIIDDQMWLVSCKVNGSTVNVQTSFDKDQKLIKVGYDTTVGPHPFDITTATDADIKSGKVFVQYARVPALESIGIIELAMREIDTDAGSSGSGEANTGSIIKKQRYYNGACNTSEIWGYPPFTLRLRMLVGLVDPIRSMRVDIGSGETVNIVSLWDSTYAFDYRERGWKEVSVLTLPWTGFPPADMEDPGPILTPSGSGTGSTRTNGNGWVQSQPCRDVDFTTLFGSFDPSQVTVP